MSDQEDLGKRLRQARQAVHLSQDQVAEALGKSRSFVALVETGRRPIDSIALSALALLYGRPMDSFFHSQLQQEDALTVLFRTAPSSLELGSGKTGEQIRACANICRIMTDLEGLLGVGRSAIDPLCYDIPAPRAIGEAIRQGESIAEQERARLKLGTAPVRDMGRLLESQGVRFHSTPLPAGASGVFLKDRWLGLAILVNSKETGSRRRFSAAHEYCHALLDHHEVSAEVSGPSRSSELPEVRANAFAAALLMPEEGVRDHLDRFFKAGPSRARLGAAYDGEMPVTGTYPASAERALQAIEVLQLSVTFGVSAPSALYRLQNLKIITEEVRAMIEKQCKKTRWFPSENESVQDSGVGLRTACISLALEAYQREAISRRKLLEIAEEAGVSVEDLGLTGRKGTDGSARTSGATRRGR